MAKVNNTDIYKYDLLPSLLDFLLGSDADNYKKTRSYRISDVIKLINGVNGRDNLQFNFSDGTDPDKNYYYPGTFFTDTNDTDPLNFTQLILNKESLQPIDLTSLFQKLAEQENLVLKLNNPSDPNNFFVFNVISIEDNTEYFTFNVTPFGDFFFGELMNETIYSLYFDVKIDSIDDKLDKDGYTGTAKTLDDRIALLEGEESFSNHFTGKSYAIWSGTGLTFDIIYTSYYLQNVLYPGGTTQITLSPADPTNPRFDNIAVDATGPIVIPGTPSPNPEITAADPNTQLSIIPVLVNAGATTPSGAISETVYNENTEWTTASNNGTVNFNATTAPFTGTKHINCGAFTNGQYIRFTAPSVNQIADYDTLKFYVNLKATFANTAKFSVKIYNGTTLISSVLTIDSGTYNFNRNTINTYQTIVIPLSAFTFSTSSFNRIEIVMVGTNASGFYLDNMALSIGGGSSSLEQNAITSIITDSGIVNATTKDDIIQFTSPNDGLVISAVGKKITFTSLFTSTLKSYYDAAKAWVDAHGNVDNTSDINKPVSTAQAAADAATLASAQSYASNLITQLIDGAPADANTLKELSDKINAINAIIGGTAPDGDSVVNTVSELLQVFATFPEGIDLVTLLAGKVNTTDVYNALDCIVAGKVLDARQGKVLNDAIATLTTALAGKEDISNKTDTVVGNETSSSKYASIKGMVDWCTSIFVRIANIKTVNGNILIGTGDIVTPDMTTNTAQDVTAVKTFRAGMFGLRNTANTFTSFFASAVTASRTWTWPDKSGTVAMTSDIVNQLTGTVNRLVKFGTTTSGSNSRIIDNGTYIGIENDNPYSKDLEFGNSKNYETGIRQSDTYTKGRDFTVSAGRTINFVETSDFLPLSQTTRQWHGLAIDYLTKDVYSVTETSGLFKQTGGTGLFTDTGLISNCKGISINSITKDIYVVRASTSDIYKQTGGSGAFTSISAGSRLWIDIAVNEVNNDVYACVAGGDIYKQTGGSGAFNALGQTARNWAGITIDTANNNVYACVDGGDIYKQTGGTGNFNGLGQTSRGWHKIAVNVTTKDVFATVYGGNIYKQSAGTGAFITLNQGNGNWIGLAIDQNAGDVYASIYGGDIYKQINNTAGTANLDGGILKLKAGTGKGTGKSRVQIVTGTKTTSGTDMQVEVVRAEFYEDGNYKRIGTPVYADNATALAGGLTVGMEYRTATGIKMEVY